jgi:putative transposase
LTPAAPRAAFPRATLAVRDRLSDELIDELLAGTRTEEEIVGPGGLLADLARRLVERALSTELTEHLAIGRTRSRPAAPTTRATARRPRRW